MPDAPAIETARLSLRAHALADFAESAAMWADPEVTRHIGGKPFSEEQSWHRLLRYVGHWALLGFQKSAWSDRQRLTFTVNLTVVARQVWAKLPTFTQYGRVDSAKPGAVVWGLHQNDDGPHGRRILMASQRYGAGLSAVLCIQNFWRWRLAKDSDPRQFDRFWRQLFRFLSEVGRQEVSIQLADQELHPQMDVQLLLEKQPNPKNITDTNHKFVVRVEDSHKNLLQEEALELEPLHPVDFKFHAEKADVYTVTVTDPIKVPIATRPIGATNPTSPAPCPSSSSAGRT